MVTVTIDGKKIEVSEGTTVLRAAQSAGINIPTLCDHPYLTPIWWLPPVPGRGRRCSYPTTILYVASQQQYGSKNRYAKSTRRAQIRFDPDLQ